MKFGWINIFAACVVVIMLIPNIVYPIRNKGEKNHCTNKYMNIIEQIGRYACIVLMWLPLLVWSFGFSSIIEMLLYFFFNVLLLSVYCNVFGMYMIKKTKKRALVLAILPSCIFLISGLMLHHWLLVGFAVLFAVGHIYVTIKNTY